MVIAASLRLGAETTKVICNFEIQVDKYPISERFAATAITGAGVRRMVFRRREIGLSIWPSPSS